jgi:hypothetical protein
MNAKTETRIPNLDKMETETLAYMLHNAAARVEDATAKGYFECTLSVYRQIRDEIAAELGSREDGAIKIDLDPCDCGEPVAINGMCRDCCDNYESTMDWSTR